MTDNTAAKAAMALDLTNNEFFKKAIEEIKEDIFWEFCQHDEGDPESDVLIYNKLKSEMRALEYVVDRLNSYILDAKKEKVDQETNI